MDDLFRQYQVASAGPDGYPREWHATIKHQVREQAGNRCVRCRHPYDASKHGDGKYSRCDEACVHPGPYRYRFEGQGEWESEWHAPLAGTLVAEGYDVQAAWRILTVHHLDGDKLNCRWWNLAALCQRCHLSIQGRVKMRRPYFLPHSDWFRPYAAGFYAFAFLGEDLSRDQVTERMSGLLALATREAE